MEICDVEDKKKINNIKLTEFFALSEKLKCVLRHGWTSTCRQESVADHCWRLALMVMTISPMLKIEIDILKALKLAIVHDFGETITGDTPYFLAREGTLARIQKQNNEKEAFLMISNDFKCIIGNELDALWNEYEKQNTPEAKFVKALDKIEAQMQQNEAPISTWLECEGRDATNGLIMKYCSFDPTLESIAQATIDKSKNLLSKNKG